MTIKEYQELAMRTVNPELDKDQMLINSVMGLCGESGEAIDIVKKWYAHGHELDIEHFKINQASILDKRKKGIRLATMHRVKGIEFDYVILVSVCDGIVPSDFILSVQENETDKQNVLRKERSLLYVALTRARKAVFVTGYKKLSSLLTYEKITS